MIRDRINNEYFEWLFDLMCRNKFAGQISYRKLLTRLHSTIFSYSIPNDANRASDGEDLRYRFILEHPQYDVYDLDYLEGPCTVFEMVAALSIRCEEMFMDDPTVGDRTRQWFWNMIVNLGLGEMSDDMYDESYVDEVVTRFLDREYGPDGEGGLFTIRNCGCDLRTVEIWYQLNWYLDEFV